LYLVGEAVSPRAGVEERVNAAASYLSLVGVTSLASFLAYGVDKRRAGIGGPRVPERTLHLLDLLGGWPGGWLGQRRFRHKTQKASFQFVFWLTVMVHLAAAGWLAQRYAG
jgi:uncharacterized membrane protein YsdA (DUF1294 family)